MVQDAVVVFVGCFNPPTKGHVGAIANACDLLREKGYNVLHGFMVPAHNEYGKPGLASNSDRFAMCRLACANAHDIDADDVEVSRGHWSRTIDTLEHFQSRFPNARIFLLVGIDVVQSFERSWRQPDVVRFVTDFSLIIISRADDVPDDLTSLCSWFGTNVENIFVCRKNDLHLVSSTLAREALAKHENTDDLLYPEVVNYITEHNLYQT